MSRPLNSKSTVAQSAVSRGWERLGKGFFFGSKLFPVPISCRDVKPGLTQLLLSHPNPCSFAMAQMSVEFISTM